MQGSKYSLINFMSGADRRFIIPVYQRNYDWKTEQCKQLFDDLVKIVRLKRKSHFLGCLVFVHSDGSFDEYFVIDGQQRLTTLSLLLLAMCHLAQKGICQAQDPNLADMILENYLMHRFKNGEHRFRLKPAHNDILAYTSLFGEESEFIEESNITINYRYFLSRIQKGAASLDELYEAIRRLEVINIILEQDDEPQLIFESLNSTGLALSEGDKIRNYILMGLPPEKQEEYYNKYWKLIEKRTNFNVSLFVRDYLSVKQQQIPSLNSVYFTFKRYREDSNTDTELLLQDLARYAKYYDCILNNRAEDLELQHCLYRLNRLETTVTRPFFMNVLQLQEEGRLPWNDVRDIFLCTESYLFRRTICDLPTNSLNKIFLMLHREIMRYDGTDENYPEKFRYALLSKTERGRFPNDQEFANAFAVKPIYQMNSKNKIYILERFENSGTVEVHDVYGNFDKGVYSIEHIMPQHLTPTWQKELGERHEEIREEWLHRLANLTLTGYNSKYGNASFAEKRDMKNGLASSHLFLNSWIGKQEHWGLAELELRNRELMQRALEIWPYPKTDFKPSAKPVISCSLDEDVALTGRLITGFRYKNSEYPVASWVQMMEQMLKILHAEDNSVLFRIAYSHDPSNGLDSFVSNNTQILRTAMEIDTHVFVEKNTSTELKISILRRLFKLYGEKEEDLIFYLKDTHAQAFKPKAKEHGSYRYWLYGDTYKR